MRSGPRFPLWSTRSRPGSEPVRNRSVGESELKAQLEARLGNGNRDRSKHLFEEPVTIQFQEIPLVEVLNSLAKEQGFQLSIDLNELDKLGIDHEVPVTEYKEDISLRLGMKLILKPWDLAYYIEDGLVVVTSSEDAEQSMRTLHYPIRDLLNRDQPAASVVRVLQLVTTTVAPDSWENVGGQGTISEYQGVLVVRQTDSIHDQLAQVIDDLRTAISSSGGPNLPVREVSKSAGHFSKQASR